MEIRTAMKDKIMLDYDTGSQLCNFNLLVFVLAGVFLGFLPVLFSFSLFIRTC